MAGNSASCFYGITNLQWLPAKLLYALLYGGAAAFTPFILPLYKTLGLTLNQMSVVEFLVIAVATISRPFVASLADKTGRRNYILGASLLLFIIPSSSLLGVYEYHVLSSNSTREEISNYIIAPDETNSTDSQMTFAIVLFLRVLGAIGFGPSFSLPDAVVYDMLGSDHAGFWGQQRLFGTIAWGTVAGLIGLMLDHFHSYSISLSTFAVITTATAILSFAVLPKGTGHLNAEKHIVAVPYSEALSSVIRNPVFLTVSVVATFSGFFIGTTEALSAALLNKLEAPKLLYGVVQITFCIFEVPVLFFAGKIINYTGEMSIFLAMFLAYSLRFFAYSFLTAEIVWFILFAEALHIFCFGLFFAAASKTMATIAPDGTSSTLQGILGTCYLGIGMGTGKLISLNIFSIFGPLWTFRIFSSVAGICFVILLLFHFVFLRNTFKKILSKDTNKFRNYDISSTINNGKLAKHQTCQDDHEETMKRLNSDSTVQTLLI